MSEEEQLPRSEDEDGMAPEPDPSEEEPDQSEDEPDQSEDEPEDEDPSSEIIQIEDLDNKTVSQHRKAFVKWINEDFYERLKELKPESSLKIYQLLVQNYLAINTPYRGLLVYHGLGTGKTATAVSLAEGLSGQMRINTLLPASLETNFIGEIMGDPVKGKMGWGKDELNIDNLSISNELESIKSPPIKIKSYLIFCIFFKILVR